MPVESRLLLRLPIARAVLSPSRSYHHSNHSPRLAAQSPLLASQALTMTWTNSSYSTSSSSSSSSSSSTAKAGKPAPSAPRPSSSVILLSPLNQVLLLHRVQTSTSFASAHVFPGGNLDAFHDGDIPAVDAPGRHEDGPAYRMGAVRECFEETGILLARRKDDPTQLVSLDVEEREAARKRIHGNQVKFGDWLEAIGGIPDIENLIPFTRWVTPTNVPKRFTTQMYLYLLPLAGSNSGNTLPSDSEILVPTPDGGVEHTAATFAPAQTFLARAAAKDIILFPPQAFLLTLVSQFVSETRGVGNSSPAEQREQLLSFIRTVPTADTPRGKDHAVSAIPWGEKCISPHNLFIRQQDGRVVLGLDRPGPELKGSARGGEWERVVLVRFAKGGPSEVEVRTREDVLAEEKRYTKESEAKL